MKRIRRMKKRTRANIIMLALVLVLSLFGTVFAWYIDSAAITGGSFGFVSFNDIDFSRSFVSSEKYNLNFHSLFSDGFSDSSLAMEFARFDKSFASFDSSNQEIYNNEFAGLWKNINTAVHCKPAGEFIRGGTIKKTYTFKNNSKIPVYFRVDTPAGNRGDIKFAYIIELDENFEEFKGHYYLSTPLAENDEVKISFTVFIPITGNPHDIRGADIIIGNAEIIQAANNAVYFVDGWKDAAEQGIFK